MAALEELIEATEAYDCLWLAVKDGDSISLDQGGLEVLPIFTCEYTLSDFCIVYGEVFEARFISKDMFYSWALVEASKHFDVIEIHRLSMMTLAIPLNQSASAALRARHLV